MGGEGLGVTAQSSAKLEPAHVVVHSVSPQRFPTFQSPCVVLVHVESFCVTLNVPNENKRAVPNVSV